ncbi:hypothetical protein Goarm_000929, partial [Gossypium armourianum]|nr:hypothetical protein [Gossypium armourianum]
MDRVLWGSPWTFNNHLLVLHRLRKGEDPNFVPLVFVEFWVQVHDLLPEFYFEEVARQLGNFVGHGDKFCQKRIDIGMQEVEYGWNLSLKTQSRRAMTTPSVWLREDNSEGIRGETLEGRGIHDNDEVSSEGMGKADMDEDSEELPLINGEGKKRLRPDKQIPYISINTLLAKVKKKHEVIYKKQISTAASMRSGLSLGWKEDLLVSLKSYSINHIDVNIEESGGLPKWRLTGFYGAPKARGRK